MASERGPDDERDRAWLLARERGESGPTIPEARARQYARLQARIADLPAVPAGTVQRRGWEQDVLAVIDAEIGQRVIDEPRPQKPTAMKHRPRRTVAAVAAALAMVVGLAMLVFRPRERELPAGPSAGGSPGSREPAEVTRGMHVARGRLGFDHALEVRGSETAAFRELRDGDTLVTRDRIRASVTTTTDAYLYLAFCADQHLQKYPSHGGVRARAGQLAAVPGGGSELVLDDHPGSEVLYLIVSQDELSQADPRLAALVAGDGQTPVGCDASLDAGLVKPGTAPHGNVLRGEREAADGAAGPGTVVAADADGIAIVRYRFRHVSPERVDRADGP